MTTEPLTHAWDEHRFIKHMASDFGLTILEDYVLYSRCYCGATPLDALLAARVANAPDIKLYGAILPGGVFDRDD